MCRYASGGPDGLREKAPREDGDYRPVRGGDYPAHRPGDDTAGWQSRRRDLQGQLYGGFLSTLLPWWRPLETSSDKRAAARSITGWKSPHYRQAAHETAPDFDKPLDTQPCEIDDSVASWQQYFLKRALNSWHSALALSLQSVDEGIPTEEAYQPNMKNHETYMSGKPATAYLYGYNKNYRLNTLHEQYLEDIPQALAALAEKYGFADVSAIGEGYRRCVGGGPDRLRGAVQPGLYVRYRPELLHRAH